MTPLNPPASRSRPHALLRWLLVLTSGASLSLASVEQASAAEPSTNPPPSTSITSQSQMSFALAEARDAKHTAESYRTAGALSKAAASWTHAAKVYEQAGNFGEAALAWTEAASIHEQDNAPHEQVQALIHLGYTLQQIGQHHKAIVALQPGRRIAEEGHATGLLAASLGQLGKANAALGNDSIAIRLFTEALTLARTEERSPLVAVLLNDLGNTLATQGNASEAISAYMESTILARGTGQSTLSMTALINAAMASIDDGQVAQAKDRLELAYRQLNELPDSHDKAFGLLNLALGYEDLLPQISPERTLLAQLDPAALPGSRGIRLKPGHMASSADAPRTAQQRNDRSNLAIAPLHVPTGSDQQYFRARSEQFFREAAVMAARIVDPTAESYALGYLGQLYEQSRQFPEALNLTRRAVFAAQQVNAPESLYRWHWQTGRIMAATGKQEDAIKSYRLAVSAVQPIRHEFSGYQGRRHSFRDSVGPIFFELADLLLKRAAVSKDPQQQQTLLIQARDTSELYKAAELQDYFKDECVKSARSRATTLGDIPKTAALIYPIILPDRLELLVNIAGTWKRAASPVSVGRLTDEVRAFRRTLQDRRTREYLSHGRQLYTWILKPLEQELAAAKIDTLVFIPDGPLRTIPMAALHDGQQFLINQFALAVTPGMDLTDLRPIDRTSVHMLSLGLTEAVQGFPALPNVQAEMDAVKAVYGGTSLIDRQFRVPAVQTELQDQQYSMVHIASHGLVGNEAKDSFLLAYDDKITMDQLSQLIGMFQFRKTSLDLLTLSACETAVGDDRAALGLAGMAVKAGARSALASLWFIDDEATSLLVTEFYKQLQNPSTSKAVALQRAQLKISSDPTHDHPSFWAPFLLINNWL
jgi:CHAT domain-containing protein